MIFAKGLMMRGPQGRTRLRPAVVTITALAALVVGLWFLVSTATSSAQARVKGASVVQPKTANRGVAPTSTSVGAQITAPPRPAPVPQSVVSSPNSASVPAVTTAAPKQASPPLAFPSGTSAPLAPSPTPRQRTVPVAVTGQVPTGVAQVATGLIGAINRQSNGSSAIPMTADNVSLLDRWMANEGGLWANNPLNTSLDSVAYPHQFTRNGQDTGIPIFPDMSSGIAATATSLESNPSYARILRVLQRGSASCVSFAKSVIRSPWASGHYGHDPAGFCSGRIVPARLHRGPNHVGKASNVSRPRSPRGKAHK